jgi:DNA-binding NtrC family response regulator
MSPHALRDLLDRLIREMLNGRITLDEGRRAFEARFIERALEACDGHFGDTAERLGIHRNTLARKVDEYKLR